LVYCLESVYYPAWAAEAAEVAEEDPFLEKILHHLLRRVEPWSKWLQQQSECR